MANLKAFAATEREGLATAIGERGTQVSGVSASDSGLPGRCTVTRGPWSFDKATSALGAGT